MMEHLLTINSVIRGYDVHIDGWDTPIGRVLSEIAILKLVHNYGDSQRLAKSASHPQRGLTDIILHRVELDHQKFICTKWKILVGKILTN